MTNIQKVEFQQVETKMISLLDKETVQKEISFAMQAIHNNSQLQKCTKESLQKAVFNIATTGLSLNPVLKWAYIVPRYVAGEHVAVLDPSYQGLIKLLTDTGAVTSVQAHVVYENDTFEVSYGSTAEIIHKPTFKNRGEIIAAYAIAPLSVSDYRQFEVMTIDEINAIRDRSESYKAVVAGKLKSCPWTEHPTEMYRKTVIKRLFKYLPKSKAFEPVARAISLSDADYSISDGQADYLVTLIERASYDDDTKAILVNKVYQGISSEEYHQMKKEAEMNTMDPITAGRPYSQSDIQNHLNKLPG
jgi:recombination protein RecT